MSVYRVIFKCVVDLIYSTAHSGFLSFHDLQCIFSAVQEEKRCLYLYVFHLYKGSVLAILNLPRNWWVVHLVAVLNVSSTWAGTVNVP
jgi:hypothetical protein